MKQSTVKEFCVSDYRRTIKLEYRIYFALIFLISIPLATFTWLTCLIMNIFNSTAKTNEGIFNYSNEDDLDMFLDFINNLNE